MGNQMENQVETKMEIGLWGRSVVDSVLRPSGEHLSYKQVIRFISLHLVLWMHCICNMRS